MILLHGIGKDEDDIFWLAPDLDPTLLIYSIRAPRPMERGGFSWFGIEFTEVGRVIDQQQALESRDLVIAFIEELHKKHKPPQLFVCGFGQGGTLSLGIALARPDLISGAVVISGVGFKALYPDPPHEKIKGLPFLIQHGQFDRVLPAFDGRDIRDELQELGAVVTYYEYDMKHEIGYENLRDIGLWLDEILPAH